MIRSPDGLWKYLIAGGGIFIAGILVGHSISSEPAASTAGANEPPVVATSNITSKQRDSRGSEDAPDEKSRTRPSANILAALRDALSDPAGGVHGMSRLSRITEAITPSNVREIVSSAQSIQKEE